MPTDFESIPHHIFFYMQDWLQTKTKDYVYINFGKKNNYYDDKYWRNFMNCNKSLREVKKRTIYLKLNGKYSKRFLNDLDYRDIVLTRVANPRNQIGLDLVNLRVKDQDLLSGIDGMNCVDLAFSNIKNVGILNNVQNLILTDCSHCENFTVLTNMKALDASDCKRLRNASSFGNIQYLDLSCTDVRDVSALGRVHTLKLSGCRNITDVSMLGNVYELDLSGCVEIRDVSNLGKVHKLNLAKCIAVKDISALGSVHTLDLTQHTGNDFSYLRNVHKLKLMSCKELVDVSMLTEVKELDVSVCPRLKYSSISDLTNLEALYFTNRGYYYGNDGGEGSDRNLDVSKLLNLKILHLRQQKLPKGIENLHLKEFLFDGTLLFDVKALIGGGKTYEDIKNKLKVSTSSTKEVGIKDENPAFPAFFQFIQSIVIRDTRELIPNLFSHIPKVTISSSSDVKNLHKYFQNVQILNLIKLDRMTTIMNLPMLEDLFISECDHIDLIKFSTLPNLKSLTMIDCKNMKNLLCIGNQLERVSMESCSSLKHVIISEKMSSMKSLRLFYCSSAIKIEIKSDLFELVLVTMEKGHKLSVKPSVRIHHLQVDDDEDVMNDDGAGDEEAAYVDPYENYVYHPEELEEVDNEEEDDMDVDDADFNDID